MSEITDTLAKLKRLYGIPSAYGRFEKKQKLPFMIYFGAGEENLPADDTIYWKDQEYQLQYYFKEKDETKEEAIEAILLEDGFVYEKSSDVYIESEDIWVIYYDV